MVRVNMLINIAKIKVLKQMLYTLEMIRQETSPSMEDEDGTCSGWVKRQWFSMRYQYAS